MLINHLIFIALFPLEVSVFAALRTAASLVLQLPWRSSK
jgi:hypothetical protein